jgi:hypothetical protein
MVEECKNESELLDDIKDLFIIDFKMKIISVPLNVHDLLTTVQYKSLVNLKRYRYSIQYSIT